MSKETQPQTKKPIYKKWWFWVGIVVVVGIIGSQTGKKEDTTSTSEGAVSSSSSSSPQPAGKPAEPKAVEVTAKDYFDAYESNEVSADARYKGKTIAITGEVDGVSKTFGIVSVNLKAAEYIKQVRCKLKEESDAASLTKGQTITLVGVGDGKTVFPEIDECVIKK